MNRLLQGDVGSGKTIVALLVMLLAIDNGYQACLMAPAKRGILLEYVGRRQLSRFVGFMEMLNVTAILVGAFAGGRLFSHWLETGGDPWAAAVRVTWVLTGLSTLAWLGFFAAAPTQSQSEQPHGSSPLRSLQRERAWASCTFIRSK